MRRNNRKTQHLLEGANTTARKIRAREKRDRALTFRCSACGAEKGQPCIDHDTGRPYESPWTVHRWRLVYTTKRARAGMTVRWEDPAKLRAERGMG